MIRQTMYKQYEYHRGHPLSPPKLPTVTHFLFAKWHHNGAVLTESPPQKIPVYTTESLAEATNMRYWDVKPLISSGRSTYCNVRQKCSTYLNARKKMFDKPYDILVLVFACPNQWSPTAIILKTEESVISFLYDVKRAESRVRRGRGWPYV